MKIRKIYLVGWLGLLFFASVFAGVGNTVDGVGQTRAGPNPWELYRNPTLIIDQLPDKAVVDVYDISGRKICSLGVEDGSGLMRWNGTNQEGNPLASGVYFLEIKTENSRKRIPLTLVR